MTSKWGEMASVFSRVEVKTTGGSAIFLHKNVILAARRNHRFLDTKLHIGPMVRMHNIHHGVL